MWPFGSGAVEAARKVAEAREEERRIKLETPSECKAVHLEEDEEYIFTPEYILPPEVPAVGPKGEAGPTGPMGPIGTSGPKGEPEVCGSGYNIGTTFGVDNRAIRDLYKMSVKTGIKPETLLGILEGAIDELPNTMLQEMREL